MYICIFIINRAMEFDDRIIYLLAFFSLVFFAVVRLGLFNPYSPMLIYFSSFITYIIIGYVVANTDLIGDRISAKGLCIVSFVVSVSVCLLNLWFCGSKIHGFWHICIFGLFQSIAVGFIRQYFCIFQVSLTNFHIGKC